MGRLSRKIRSRCFAWGCSFVLMFGFDRLLMIKSQDEMKALQLCQTKVRQKKLPMEVVDAEYQWYVFRSSYLADAHQHAGTGAN